MGAKQQAKNAQKLAPKQVLEKKQARLSLALNNHSSHHSLCCKKKKLFKVNPKHFWLKDDGKFPQVGKKIPQKRMENGCSY